MKSFLGVMYSRGACATVQDGGPYLAPQRVQEMFPAAQWTMIRQPKREITDTMSDRFGDTYNILQQIYQSTPRAPHIMIGGDHSVNFGHFAALADQNPDADLCLVYIDAHLDIHTPQSSQEQASGAPHGTNVRALLGDGDARWLKLCHQRPALRPENLFYFGTRDYEPAEIEFVRAQNIFVRTPQQLATMSDLMTAIKTVQEKIGNRKYVVSFDFDAIEPHEFGDVWVPADNGISLAAAKQLIHAFAPNAYGFEFVEWAPTGDKNCESIVQDLISIVAA